MPRGGAALAPDSGRPRDDNRAAINEEPGPVVVGSNTGCPLATPSSTCPPAPGPGPARRSSSSNAGPPSCGTEPTSKAHLEPLARRWESRAPSPVALGCCMGRAGTGATSRARGGKAHDAPPIALPLGCTAPTPLAPTPLIAPAGGPTKFGLECAALVYFLVVRRGTPVYAGPQTTPANTNSTPPKPVVRRGTGCMGCLQPHSATSWMAGRQSWRCSSSIPASNETKQRHTA